MIPTLSTYLYQINRNRAALIAQFEKRKALRYAAAIVTVVAVGVIAWILRP